MLYSFAPVSARNFCFRRLMTLSTEFTELPRSFAISSLEKPSAFRWKIRASSGVRRRLDLAQQDVALDLLDRAVQRSAAAKQSRGRFGTRRGSTELASCSAGVKDTPMLSSAFQA